MTLPNGIVLVTGPTGSGKTTTLYTALKHLNRPELKLFTVEDPIEYQLSGINQIQVQPQIGLDFPAALRSILRQDPDIVMIGEIRDLETARIAIQAALDRASGLLDTAYQQRDRRDYASDRHRTGALSSRFDGLGGDGAAPGSKALSGLLAPAQRKRAHARKTQAGGVRESGIDLSNSREAVGCEACAGTGYRGRTTISELLMVDDGIREAIGRRSQDQRLIEQLARTNGFRTLYEDGLMKVGAGETTLEEVLRVTRAS